MGEIIIRKVRSMSRMAKISLVLICTILFIALTFQGWQAPVGRDLHYAGAYAGWVTNPMLHNSVNLRSSKWSSAWGIPGGKYGEFTCETCHDRSTPNIKRIKVGIKSESADTWPNGWLTTANISFTQASWQSNFSDMAWTSTNQSFARICSACHDSTLAGGNHIHYAWNTTDRKHNVGLDCGKCHMHSKAFAGSGECVDCHASVQGARGDVVNDFKTGNSHHVQYGAYPTTLFTTIAGRDCAKCHWEAKITDGSMDSAYHLTAPGQVVDLVVWNSTTRPGVYSLGTTAVQYTASTQTKAEIRKLNQVCLGCHDDQNKNVDSFGDGKKPSFYAWDTSSIDSRYSDWGTTTWGKYGWASNGARKVAQKAYSVHGNTASNSRGWDTVKGIDETIPNIGGTESVACFDCHNSHGSWISGRATSYSTFGGLLKNVRSGQGGYSVTYAPGRGGSAATFNSYEPGAGLCFDCHMTERPGMTTGDGTGRTPPWGWRSFGALGRIIGYWEKPYWWGSNLSAAGNNSGAQMRYAYKNWRKTAGSHFGKSGPMATTPQDTIDGVCSSCHDPHGVSATLGANRQYAVPLLKGTFITSPYREDAAPLITAGKGGGADFQGYTDTSHPGYHVDQNTFKMPNRWGSVEGTDRISNGLWWSSLYDLTSSTTGGGGAGEKITHTDTEFGGLCLRCHPKAQIKPNTAGWNTWMNMQRVHNTVQGWGTLTALNANNKVHGYVCSKCHTPHSSCLPKLMITNCLDNSNHRGRRSGGGAAAIAHSTSSTSGGGTGRYPGGGSGYGCQGSAGRRSGKWGTRTGGYYFGRVSTAIGPPAAPNGPTCHSTQWTTFQAQRWNTVTQWSSL